MKKSAPIVVMGVSGCGKSTIASMLATHLGGTFLDADDFHPESNREKMAAGTPLNDDDRRPWLRTLNLTLKSPQASAKHPVVLACSALRQNYRDHLSEGIPELRFVYLRGSKELIAARMAERSGHFMPTSLLDSQFATLEEPTDALTVDIDRSENEIVDAIVAQLE